MTRILLPLLFSPVFLKAQILEGSLSPGLAVHNFIAETYPGTKARKNLSYNLSFSGTVKMPYGLRAGLSISYLRLGYNFYDYSFVHTVHKVYINPILFECIVLSRNNFRRCNVDFGIIAGVCGNRQMISIDRNDHMMARTTRYRRPWYTYGLLGSYQYHIHKKYAIGGEVQAKILSGLPENIFVFPFTVKCSIRI